MVNDSRFDYPVVAASKAIIRKGDEILFTREPLDHDWMPGRLGLPGGKYYLHEGVFAGTKRKIREETGTVCEIKGVFKIVQILMPEKTVYQIVVVADYVSDEMGVKEIYSAGLEWLKPEQVRKLGVDDLAEYYLPAVLSEYLAHPNRLVPTDLILELRSFADPEIQDWMRKGSGHSA